MLSKAKRAELFANLLSADNSEIVEALMQDSNDLSAACEQCGTIAEDGESATFAATEPEQAGKSYEQEYLDLKKKYVERFMGGVEETEEQPEETDETEEPETADDVTVDSLFEKEEN